MKNRIVLFVFVAFASTVLAQEKLTKFGIEEGSEPKGLSINSELPIVSGFNSKGERQALNSFADSDYLVVVFFRGEWCPYCTKHLNNLADSLSYLKSKGAAVLAVTPDQTPPKAYGLKGIYPIRDIDNQIMIAFDVDFDVTKGYGQKIKTFKGFDLAEYNGQESPVLPVPATFVFDKNRKLVARYFDPNYKKRPSVRWVINQLN